jgi:ABC-type iron transport system FetAB ATPase subunit
MTREKFDQELESILADVKLLIVREANEGVSLEGATRVSLIASVSYAAQLLLLAEQTQSLMKDLKKDAEVVPLRVVKNDEEKI